MIHWWSIFKWKTWKTELLRAIYWDVNILLYLHKKVNWQGIQESKLLHCNYHKWPMSTSDSIVKLFIRLLHRRMRCHMCISMIVYIAVNCHHLAIHKFTVKWTTRLLFACLLLLIALMIGSPCLVLAPVKLFIYVSTCHNRSWIHTYTIVNLYDVCCINVGLCNFIPLPYI